MQQIKIVVQHTIHFFKMKIRDHWVISYHCIFSLSLEITRKITFSDGLTISGGIGQGMLKRMG